MRKNLLVSSMMAFVLTLAVGTAEDAMAQQAKPILIGVNTAIQLQVGRDSMDGVKMAIDEINEQGGVLGRKFEMVTADEGEAANEGAKVGIAAVNKLTSEDHVDVLIGGYDSGVTLGELPHIPAPRRSSSASVRPRPPSQRRSRTITSSTSTYSASVRSIRPSNSNALLGFISGKLKGELGYKKISIMGENAKWVQDMVPAIQEGRRKPLASRFRWRSSSTCRRPTSRRSSPR